MLKIEDNYISLFNKNNNNMICVKQLKKYISKFILIDMVNIVQRDIGARH